MLPTILIIDDDAATLKMLGFALRRRSYRVIAVTNIQQGLEKFEETDIDMVLCDLRIGDETGIDLLRSIKKLDPDIPVVIISMKDQETDRIWGERQGARAYLTKPVSEKQLLNTITQVARH